jgi:SAM-dependent methyltransferase
MNNVVLDLQLDQFRKNFLKYSRQAFLLLPSLVAPRILDIGCGSGLPALELASLSDGLIIGIDIDQPLLDIFSERIRQAGLSACVHAVNCSLFHIAFPHDLFDILWTEGVIGLIGFARGLQYWRHFLRSQGFLVVHDDSNNLSQKLQAISRHGYRLLEHFSLPDDAWWQDFYSPLEAFLDQLPSTYATRPDLRSRIDDFRYQIRLARKNPAIYRSTFFIMQKI